MTRVLYILFCAVVILSVLEAGARLAMKDRYGRDESNLAYRYDPVLGWFPEKNSKKIFEAARRVMIRHNSRGFRDKETGAVKSRPRIAFLGDSFVWGYDVEEKDRFTEKIQKKLKN